MADGSSVSTTESSEYMGPYLLALQPVLPRKSAKELTHEWTVAYNKLEARLQALKTWRWSWWTYWSSLAAYFNPRRFVWLVTANKQWRGSSINDQIIDSTGLQAVRTCAGGMWTGLTSPSRPWFSLELAQPDEDLDAESKAWIEDTQTKVYTVLAQSNFYNTMAQAFEDITVFGTAPIVVYENFESVVRFYLPAAGEYYLGVGPDLTTDTFYREFTYTVSQIVARWQVENCPEMVRNLWAQGTIDTEFVVAHSIEPNFAFNDGADREIRLLSDDFTWREVYWLRGQKSEQPLEVHGFRGQPFFGGRWSTVSNDAYGRSPCMDALGDNKQVQFETLRKAEFIEKGVRPPMGADPSLKNEPASIIPGNITYVNAEGQRKGFWPLFEPRAEWLVALTADIDKVNARIDKCLFVDLFMAISRMEGVQPRNQLELTQRNMERLQELGPFIHMFETEFAAPMLQRVIDIMRRKGIILPMPESLQGKAFKIAFTSIMRQAQRAMESVSVKDVLQVGGSMSLAAKNAGLPDPLRNLNLDKTFRRYGELNDFDKDLWFTKAEVEEHDAARAKGEADAQVLPDAMAAIEGAKSLSQTPLNQGTALDSIIGSSPV